MKLCMVKIKIVIQYYVYNFSMRDESENLPDDSQKIQSGKLFNKGAAIIKLKQSVKE